MQNIDVNVTEPLDLDEYMSIKELCALFPSFKESTIRYYVANPKKNDFEICTAKWGGRVKIHKKRFKEWANKRLVKSVI